MDESLRSAQRSAASGAAADEAALLRARLRSGEISTGLVNALAALEGDGTVTGEDSLGGQVEKTLSAYAVQGFSMGEYLTIRDTLLGLL